MRKLSDTIARLAAMRTMNGSMRPAPTRSERLKDLGDFGSNPGALKARIHVPAGLPDDAPLVVVLHGCTQNADGYDAGAGWSELADEAGFAVLYPEQDRSNNPNLCFNWFVPADIKRGSGEALSIRQMIEAMVVTHRLDRKRIYVTGLSAGGGMAATMLAAYPEVFAGGGLIAGLAHGVAGTIPEAFDRMRGQGLPPAGELQKLLRDASTHEGPWPVVSIWQGTADQTVVPANAQAIVDQWRGVHGLGEAPTLSQTVGRHAQQIWSDKGGRTLVELHLINGMAHGTPLKAQGSGSLGTPAPYLLDVGISSTRAIADFWGIAEGVTVVAGASERTTTNVQTLPVPVTPAAGRAGAAPSGRARATADDGAGRPHPSTAGGVKAIIEDALRAAGLMR
ncbi:extracellular catalytic domain type 1 short-chain-length polyhydroxyalkanoate depolymerase [Methylobrevis albus]|uniref:PHB depolymerase family esterase n=1 Tax=Methylobrevis albus TaxID=2793297 RepID=A0A931MX18_9HYPH|nr:PHB depolymerase family esterase [Methylobrevis albus]MBH0236377.1 PHB depolymerase family esterase [Methylobrevis albus]